MLYDDSADNFRVHFYRDDKDRGRISCPLATREEAERWIGDWKSVDPKYKDDDLRIHQTIHPA